ncbi:MAG TPA: hypothetical protein VKI43_05140, partial [Vicinamibacterales bacterium]|nr:hypothetical protein [Vicinamibacterales bacterium]
MGGAAAAGGGAGAIKSPDLREWLTYIASDELEGRAVFTAGYGLAAAYVSDHLHAWGVKPAGDHGSYLQTVRVLGVKTTSRSSVSVTVGGETRTFADGDGITFPRNMGGTHRFTVDRVEFAGYGLDAPGAGHVDFRGKDVKDAAVIWLGNNGPKSIDASVYRRVLVGRNRYATEQLGAAASIGPESVFAGAGRAGGAGQAGAPGAAAASPAAGGGRGAPLPAADFTTVQRLDTPAPPTVSANDAFFTFLFSRAPEAYEELKRKASAQEDLPSFRLSGVAITFNVDADYQIVRTQLTQNVVGVIEGSDPQLKSTYVAFGAHLDHVGYAEGEVTRTDNTPRRAGAVGRVTPGKED